MPPHAYDFCVVVGIDAIHVAIGDHASKSYLNILDWGTRFVQAVRLECPHDAPTSRACLQAYLVGWAKIFGHPEVIITDQGNEFRDVFAEALTAEGVFLATINACAPWEQGITERHGAAIKEQARIAAAMTDVLTDDDVDELVAAACLSHYQFPSDLVSDQQLDSDVLALGTKRQFQKSQKLRLAARQAFFKYATTTRVQRAAKAAIVQQPRFSSGDTVFVMRRGAFGRTWREGPGAVIATQGGTAWIAVQGDLYKCSNLSLKRAIGEEQLGIEAVRARIPDLQMQLRSKRRVRDATAGFAPSGGGPLRERRKRPSQRLVLRFQLDQSGNLIRLTHLHQRRMSLPAAEEGCLRE
eukprot:6492779-Amphidinium_carterae.1